MKGKPPNIIPSTRLEFRIPADLRVRMDLHLFSNLEQRVPHGAHKEFICKLIKDFFEQLDKGEPTS